MAMHYEIGVFIDGINRTSRTVAPLKWGNFLDERLDECHLSLRAVKKANFPPLKPVEFVMTATEYFGIWNNKPKIVKSQTKNKKYIIANDNAVEVSPGSGLYNHDLYLIEVTKIAECHVVDTITFTNNLGDHILEGSVQIVPTTNEEGTIAGGFQYYTPPTYVSPILPGTLKVERIRDVIQNFIGSLYGYERQNGYAVRIGKDGKSIYYNEYFIGYDTAEQEYIKGKDKTYSLELEANHLYTVEYVYSFINNSINQFSGIVRYVFTVVDNQMPLKKWTITDVINRTLDLAEPIRQGKKSRFRLNGMRADGTIITDDDKQEGEVVGQAALFDKILAPEFSFTKQTLRECLQEVGGVIHGEPRLTPKEDADGWYYEVTYDMYASQDKSDICFMPYTTKNVQHVIENYAGWLDSNAENLVNELDKYSGVIVEPYADGAKSVRTENTFVRIFEGNMIIATKYPIYSVEKLEYAYNNGTTVQFVDLTPYLFEKSIYDTQLSSYRELYPYSKAYAIYYSQGSKNISGLNFKVDSATMPAFKDYAITNILGRIFNDTKTPDYPNMCFRVTYTPFYNARIGQTKSYYKDFIRPAALIYNQQSNVIESRYYGENLKGAIARLGNIELSLTYVLKWFSQIPKAGQKFDDNYYISAVAIEVLPTYIRCTIGLSKDFNRLSRYIGISSVKRYSEISQKQAVERNTLYREYIVIGEKEKPDTDCLINDEFFWWVKLTFLPQEIGGIERVTNVCAWGTSYNGNVINNSAVNLPVISSAFGNSISFSWTYEDNYSAGATSQHVEKSITSGSNKITGYFQNSYPYTDPYGRIYYYHFDLQTTGPIITATNYTEQGRNLPAGNVPTKSSAFVSTIGQTPYILRKDNREALQVNFQIDFVTNIPTLIIGSALTSYNPAVRGIDAKLAKAKLYVFPTELNKFTDHVEAFEDVDLSMLPSAELRDNYVGEGYWVLDAKNFPDSGKSWAIVTPQDFGEPKMVMDEQGNPSEQREVMGGDLLIGQNIEVTEGQAFTPIYFTKKREIFDKSVWTDRR